MIAYLDISRRVDGKWNVWRRIREMKAETGYSDYWVIVRVCRSLHEAHKFIHGGR